MADPAESMTTTPVAIVGGGLVGMALALSLAQRGIASLLLEAAAVDADPSEHFDDRTLVVNPAAWQFWQELGIWSLLDSQATPIHHVHVSNQGQFGVVHFNHDELQVPQLGHVVAAKTLAHELWQQVQQQPLIDCRQPAQLTDFQVQNDGVELQFDANGQGHTLQAQLLVAADGVQSAIRQQLQLATDIKSYERTAIICNVQTDQGHQHRAFERLTREGPMALLPFNNRFGFVWSMNNDQADAMMAADDATFMAQAQQGFGYRAGQFQTIGRRSRYPLYRIKVPKQHAQRVVLMGNAAHAVSPVSAQGLNLAVRGIKRLAAVLAEHHQQGNDLGAEAALQAYQQASERDQQRTLNYTDDLMTWFQIDEPLVNTIRSMGLVAINASLPLKRKLFETAGGLRA
ncbi:FAD-dependent monooxygenase [Marinicella meishanensis]|uniref:FAD-dependent monooxygenase n=1 Tax=Marinicella meishanensis TaxID=2873263 RepID=UPI001CC116A6|nr:FAD-dependent monooxygenase [Marinicella sp. NBU2979]